MSPHSPEDAAYQYYRIHVSTASVAHKICILHEKTIQLFHLAESDPVNKREYLDRIQNIVLQLDYSLADDGPTSKSLHYLYNHCFDLLESDNPKDHHQAYAIIHTLKDTFHELV